MITRKKFNKRASISATLTWIVATMIVFFILILFLAAIILVDFKKEGIRVNVGKEEVSQDLVYTQIALSYLNSEINGKIVRDLIREKGYESKEEISEHTFDFFNNLGLVWDVNVFEVGIETPRSYTLGNQRLGCSLEERKVEVISPLDGAGKIIVRVYVCEKGRSVEKIIGENL